MKSGNSKQASNLTSVQSPEIFIPIINSKQQRRIQDIIRCRNIRGLKFSSRPHSKQRITHITLNRL